MYGAIIIPFVQEFRFSLFHIILSLHNGVTAKQFENKIQKTTKLSLAEKARKERANKMTPDEAKVIINGITYIASIKKEK
jgi:hypothetical protein